MPATSGTSSWRSRRSAVSSVAGLGAGGASRSSRRPVGQRRSSASRPDRFGGRAGRRRRDLGTDGVDGRSVTVPRRRWVCRSASPRTAARRGSPGSPWAAMRRAALVRAGIGLGAAVFATRHQRSRPARTGRSTSTSRRVPWAWPRVASSSRSGRSWVPRVRIVEFAATVDGARLTVSAIDATPVEGRAHRRRRRLCRSRRRGRGRGDGERAGGRPGRARSVGRRRNLPDDRDRDWRGRHPGGRHPDRDDDRRGRGRRQRGRHQCRRDRLGDQPAASGPTSALGRTSPRTTSRSRRRGRMARSRSIDDADGDARPRPSPRAGPWPAPGRGRRPRSRGRSRRSWARRSWRWPEGRSTINATSDDQRHRRRPWRDRRRRSRSACSSRRPRSDRAGPSSDRSRSPRHSISRSAGAASPTASRPATRSGSGARSTTSHTTRRGRSRRSRI